METRTDITSLPRGQAVTGTLIHEGREYTSGGGYFDDYHVVAYLKGPDTHRGATGLVQLWNGATIGTYRITGRWRLPFNAWISSHMISARVRLEDGREYVGRGCGAGMIWQGRRVADQLSVYPQTRRGR